MHACSVYRAACRGCADNCHYMLFSNKIGSLVDLLHCQLNVSDVMADGRMAAAGVKHDLAQAAADFIL